MSYENISVNIAAVEETLGKLRKARMDVDTAIMRLQQLANISGEGLTAEEQRTNEKLLDAAVFEAAMMDSMIALTGETLEAYAGTDEALAKRIRKALYGQ